MLIETTTHNSEAAQLAKRSRQITDRLIAVAEEFVREVAESNHSPNRWLEPDSQLLVNEGITFNSGAEVGPIMDKLWHIVWGVALLRGDFRYEMEWEAEKDDDGHPVASGWSFGLFRYEAK